MYLWCGGQTRHFDHEIDRQHGQPTTPNYTAYNKSGIMAIGSFAFFRLDGFSASAPTASTTSVTGRLVFYATPNSRTVDQRGCPQTNCGIEPAAAASAVSCSATLRKLGTCRVAFWPKVVWQFGVSSHLLRNCHLLKKEPAVVAGLESLLSSSWRLDYTIYS